MSTFFYGKSVDNLTITVFRILFGIMMCVSAIRFMQRGWIEELYIKPVYHFSYFGFAWVQPLSSSILYAIFIGIVIFSLCITLGFLYRITMFLFFITFTYIELLDKTYYLNHYYFVSVISFIMIFLPLHKRYSLDSIIFSYKNKKNISSSTVQVWVWRSLQCMVGLVYFYAGVAKINADWLLEALPLRIWLPLRQDYFLIGNFLTLPWVAFVMSWCGMLFDLTVPFFLFWRKTRPYAYIAVVCFHALTGWLFDIGVFPLVMICGATVFFTPDEFYTFFRKIGISLRKPIFMPTVEKVNVFPFSLVSLVLGIQLLFPLRHIVYPSQLMWSEEGFRFAWNVMLMEKTAYLTFYLHDPDTQRSWEVSSFRFLTPLQEKMMSTQADMILQMAHYLGEKEKAKGRKNIEVRAECYVSMNGRAAQLYIDPQVDLMKEKESLMSKKWILPLKDKKRVASFLGFLH